MHKTIALMLLLSLALFGCSESPTGTNQDEESKDMQPGEYYSFVSGDGDYKVLKVLVVDEKLVHVCYYNNIFKKQPTKDIVSSLFFGKQKSDDVFLDVSGNQQTTGRKHIALTLNNWKNWQPEWLSDGEVDSDELAAYEEWKNGDREVLTFRFIPAN